MALIRKTIEVEAQVGDEVKAPNTVYRSDLQIYICHIEGDILFVSPEKDRPKNECETTFAEDCYIVNN
jgi:hypothetical protein